MTRAISRRISNLEDMEVLTKKETEKAVKTKRTNRSLVESPSIAIYKSIDTADRYHSGFQKANK